MRRSYSIDIQLFHNLDIPEHLLLSDDISSVGAHLMTVHAFNENRLAVHEKLVVPDSHSPVAELERCALHQSFTT